MQNQIKHWNAECTEEVKYKIRIHTNNHVCLSFVDHDIITSNLTAKRSMVSRWVSGIPRGLRCCTDAPDPNSLIAIWNTVREDFALVFKSARAQYLVWKLSRKTSFLV